MMTLNHKFVEKIPNEIEDGILYISIPFETVIHKCCCGCGNEVVTPLSPSQWSLTFDGETVTLDPSIGSWSLNCQSHYFIRKNKVVWSYMYDKKEINKVKKADNDDNIEYFERRNKIKTEKVMEIDYKDDSIVNLEGKNSKIDNIETKVKKKSFWTSILNRLFDK